MRYDSCPCGRCRNLLEKLSVIQQGIIGRKGEITNILATLAAGKHILLEGPPGTSKSSILRRIAAVLQLPFYLVEGNIDLVPAKLVGQFNPAKVLAQSFHPDFFEKGPLTLAMEQGGILYLEEFNRMPADIANVLITPMEEGELNIPRFGTVRAKPGFRVIAAQNPYDDVGTVRVSRAFMDRICRITLDYQPEEEEISIVQARTGIDNLELVAAAVKIVRQTRQHQDIKLGASVRAAIDIVAICNKLQVLSDNLKINFEIAVLMALTGKIWLSELTSRTPEDILGDLIRGLPYGSFSRDQIPKPLADPDKKKIYPQRIGMYGSGK